MKSKTDAAELAAYFSKSPVKSGSGRYDCVKKLNKPTGKTRLYCHRTKDLVSQIEKIIEKILILLEIHFIINKI